MSLQDLARGWRVGVSSDWADVVADLPSDIERARKGEANRLLPFMSNAIIPALLIGHAEAAGAVESITPILSLAVEQEEEMLDPHGPIGFAPLAVVSAVNVFACAGAHVDARTWNTMREWLPRLEVSRDDAWTTRYWSSGFAALALESPAAYRRVAAEDLAGPAPDFSPGLAFEFNLQALLRYLRAAIQRSASLADVTPAWHGFLAAYEPLWRSNSVDTRTLFWVGRLVFHHVGGRPLGEVANAIHESIWEFAGMEP